MAGAGQLHEEERGRGWKHCEWAAGGGEAWPVPTLPCRASVEAASRPCSSSSCSSSSCSSVGSKLYMGMSWWRSFSSLGVGVGAEAAWGRAGPSPPSSPPGPAGTPVGPEHTTTFRSLSVPWDSMKAVSVPALPQTGGLGGIVTQLSSVGVHGDCLGQDSHVTGGASVAAS